MHRRNRRVMALHMSCPWTMHGILTLLASLVWELSSDVPSVSDVKHVGASGGCIPPCCAVAPHAPREKDRHGSIHPRHKQLLVSLLPFTLPRVLLP
eukprot:3936872-Rhodomonas_salina.7